MFADCRKCVYFVSEASMDPDVLEKALCWIHHNRPGAVLLGYCMKYDRPVTYFQGKCRAFKPRKVRTMKITDFIKVQGP